MESIYSFALGLGGPLAFSTAVWTWMRYELNKEGRRN